MAKASTTLTFPVSAEHYFNAVLDYEAYPEFLSGCKSAKVQKKSGKKTEVEYDVSMVKDISYVLEHIADPSEGVMKWSLVESDFVVKNNGEWQIKEIDDEECEVTYSIDIEFKIPVPGLILSGLVKSSLPKMLKEFASHAEKLKKQSTKTKKKK